MGSDIIKNRDWEDVKRILSRYYGEWTKPDYPGAVNDRIPNSAILGNGDIGISSDGSSTEKVFNISKGNFWEYNGSPLKLGLISVGVTRGDTADDSEFNEREYLADATTVTKQTLRGVPLQIDSWVSATSNLFVMKLTSLSSRTDANVTVSLKAHIYGGRPVSSSAENRSIMIKRSSLAGEACSYVSAAAAVTRVIGADGKYTSNGRDSSTAEFILPKNGTVYIVTAVCGGGKTYDCEGALMEGRTAPEDEAYKLIDTVGNEADIELLRREHLDWWRDYWLRSYISLDTSDPDVDVVQKYYYAAQYELGCGVREGKLAPGLYGIWHTTDNAYWHSDYHLNYNFVSAFYGLGSSNRASMLLPAADAIMEYVPVGLARARALGQPDLITDGRDARIREFAKELIGKGQIERDSGITDAVLYPVSILPFAMEGDNVYHGELVDAPFSAFPMIEYYNYTLDKEFLKNVLYPYLTYVLNFMEHWIVEENGEYVWYAAYNESSWAKNAVLETGAYRMCLECGINAADELGDTEKAEKWRLYRGRMPKLPVIDDYKVSGKTVLGIADLYQSSPGSPWLMPSDLALTNGNPLPLESIIPFGLLGYYSTEEELETARNTVDVFDRDMNSWEQINSFPKIYAAAVCSRYDCRKIISKLAATIRKQIQLNLMIEDTIHGIEKAGATAAVNDMLLLSDKGIIKLFGCWDRNLDARFVRLRAKGAFLFTAEYRGNTHEITEGATMYSETGAAVALASLWPEGMTVLDEEGNPVRTAKSTAPGHEEEAVYTFDTKPGMTYTFIKKLVDRAGCAETRSRLTKRSDQTLFRGKL